MSFDFIRWALERKPSSPSQKFVLVALANYANKETGKCFPSLGTLSEDTGYNRKTVVRAIAGLKDSGFIKDTGGKVGYTKSVVIYELNPEPDKQSHFIHEAVPPWGVSCPTVSRKQALNRVPEPVKEPVIEPIINHSSEAGPKKGQLKFKDGIAQMRAAIG